MCASVLKACSEVHFVVAVLVVDVATRVGLLERHNDATASKHRQGKDGANESNDASDVGSPWNQRCGIGDVVRKLRRSKVAEGLHDEEQGNRPEGAKSCTAPVLVVARVLLEEPLVQLVVDRPAQGEAREPGRVPRLRVRELHCDSVRTAVSYGFRTSLTRNLPKLPTVVQNAGRPQSRGNLRAK